MLEVIDFRRRVPIVTASGSPIGTSLDTELVPVRVLHDDQVVALTSHGCAERDEPPDFIFDSPRRALIEVQPVLRLLGLRHSNDPHVRTAPSGRLDVRPLRGRVLIDVRAQDRGPECRRGVSDPAVESDALEAAWGVCCFVVRYWMR